MPGREFELSPLERRLLNDYQRDISLDPCPFARIAEQLGVSESTLLEMLRRLKAAGVISRVGPVLAPNRAGASTLAAIAVPPPDLVRVAALVSRYPEVNHNYEREHHFNLWFVVTAPDRLRLQQVLDEIRDRSGLPVLDLPMLENYFIDLGFPMDWGDANA
jgi:siroheme decarboxylase